MSALDQYPWRDDGVPVAVVRTDSDLRATSANDAWRELSGNPVFLPGIGWTALFDPDDHSVVRTWLRRFSRRNRADAIEVRGRTAGRWFELRAARGDGELFRPDFVVAVVDITTYKRREAELAFDATHDSLTGLRNRPALIEHIEEALTRLQRRDSILAVLFIDLDGFKRINDGYGHPVGDDVLRAVAQHLSAAVRPMDTLARLGGDEFIVICESLSTESEAFTIARRLDAAVRRVHLPDLGGVRLSAAVGVAFAHGSEDRPTAMIGRADRAMYLAKQGIRDPADESAVDEPLAVLRMHDLRPRFVDVLVRLAGELDGEWGGARRADDAVEWEAACRHVRQAIALLTTSAAGDASGAESDVS